ncbi:hypothetical protein [Mesorhizobium sp. CN2-181]|uniref:hypothetical protein n=1 Tax=Mesorhizobium yinganensis TaxID=3157707 RepID=UPI0032B709E9
MSEMTLFLLAVAAMAVATLWIIALREHSNILAQRASLLDAIVPLFSESTVVVGRDGFPVLDGSLGARRRIRIELIADTLVTRRLPQLWLKQTLLEPGERSRPSIGALSRPTGAEFYSVVHDLPMFIAPPDTERPILVRGDAAITAEEIERANAMFSSLFRDPGVKEAVITPRGARLIRQVSEGDRGAHLILRQVRFPLDRIPQSAVKDGLAELEALNKVFER